MPCLRHVVASSTQGSPPAYSTTSTRSLPRVPLPVAAACQPYEELKDLPTKTTSPSITHIKRPPSGTQHSATNASNCNQGTRSRTAPRTDNAVFAAATSTNPSSASPCIRDATRTSARCLVGTTITAHTVPPTPLEGLTAS